jgi:hypothetical protein
MARGDPPRAPHNASGPRRGRWRVRTTPASRRATAANPSANPPMIASTTETPAWTGGFRTSQRARWGDMGRSPGAGGLAWRGGAARSTTLRAVGRVGLGGYWEPGAEHGARGPRGAPPCRTCRHLDAQVGVRGPGLADFGPRRVAIDRVGGWVRGGCRERTGGWGGSGGPWGVPCRAGRHVAARVGPVASDMPDSRPAPRGKVPTHAARSPHSTRQTPNPRGKVRLTRPGRTHPARVPPFQARFQPTARGKAESPPAPDRLLPLAQSPSALNRPDFG